MNSMVTSSPNSFRVGPKTTGTPHERVKRCARPRGFTLNVRGAAVLNFQTMKDNILAELESIKQYGLVFDQHVINTDTKSSYPYGYKRIGEESERLLDL